MDGAKAFEQRRCTLMIKILQPGYKDVRERGGGKLT